MDYSKTVYKIDTCPCSLSQNGVSNARRTLVAAVYRAVRIAYLFCVLSFGLNKNQVLIFLTN